MPMDVLAGLWRAAGHSDAALAAVKLTGGEPALPSSFAIGTAAQATIAAAALAAAELWRLHSDGCWVRLHTNLPHHRDGLLALALRLWPAGGRAYSPRHCLRLPLRLPPRRPVGVSARV